MNTLTRALATLVAAVVLLPLVALWAMGCVWLIIVLGHII